MKKSYLLLISLLTFGYGSFAQNVATPNPGFENWTQVGNHFDPNNWNTLNPSTGIIGVFTCTRASGADVHSGTYAIKLTTKSVFGITANGIASTATLITTPPYGVTGGIAYTERPDSIVGWYKCTPASSADSGFVQFVLLGASNDTIGFAKYNMPNSSVSSYTRFSTPITYFSSGTPTLSYWILSSSDGANPVVNSNIFIDDIDLIFLSTGIDSPDAQAAVEVVNTVVTDLITIKNRLQENVNFRIYDQSGRLIKSDVIKNGIHEIDLQTISNGIYFYQLINPEMEIFETGKLLRM